MYREIIIILVVFFAALQSSFICMRIDGFVNIDFFLILLPTYMTTFIITIFSIYHLWEELRWKKKSYMRLLKYTALLLMTNGFCWTQFAYVYKIKNFSIYLLSVAFIPVFVASGITIIVGIGLLLASLCGKQKYKRLA
jgi:hypothetical protein